MGNLINNTKWTSSINGRLSEDDVCIGIETDRHDGSVEIHLEFDAQEQAIIKLDCKQREQLQKLLTENR